MLSWSCVNLYKSPYNHKTFRRKVSVETAGVLDVYTLMPVVLYVTWVWFLPQQVYCPLPPRVRVHSNLRPGARLCRRVVVTVFELCVFVSFRRWIWAAVSVSDVVAQDTGWRTAPIQGVAVGGAEVEGKVRTSCVRSSVPLNTMAQGTHTFTVFVLQICSVTGVESRDTSPAIANRPRTVRPPPPPRWWW